MSMSQKHTARTSFKIVSIPVVVESHVASFIPAFADSKHETASAWKSRANARFLKKIASRNMFCGCKRAFPYYE